MSTNTANLSYESARLKLYRLSSLSGPATARIEEAIDRELGTLHAASMASPEFSSMEDSELAEAAARTGLSLTALKDDISRRAAEAKADLVLGKLDLAELQMLAITCGPESSKVERANHLVALRGTNKGLR